MGILQSRIFYLGRFEFTQISQINFLKQRVIMLISECDDYKFIDDRDFEFNDEIFDKMDDPKKGSPLYTYTINKHENNDFLEATYSDYFLLRLFPFLPDINDCRYKIIQEYTTDYKKSSFTIERNRCIAFELAARNKENTNDIKNIISYYTKHEDTIDELLGIMEIRGREYIHQNNNAEITPLKDIFENMCSMAKKLKLIPYKDYPSAKMFPHWVINPDAYRIVGMCAYYEGVNSFKHHVSINKQKDTGYGLKITPSAELYDVTVERNKNLSDTVNFKQTYVVSEDTIETGQEGSDIMDGIVFDKLKKNIQNSNDISHIITQNFQYPKIENYSKMTIEVELSSQKSSVKKFIEEAITSLNALIDSNYFEEDDLFKIFSETTQEEFHVVLFIYDYFTFRQEQIKHKLTFGLNQDIDEITTYNKNEILESNIGWLPRQLHPNTNIIGIDDAELTSKEVKNKIAISIKKDVSVLVKNIKKTNEKIYNELENIFSTSHKPITASSIKKYLEAITTKIEQR